MSTQLIGFSIGGIGKRFLVQPPSMSMHYYFCVKLNCRDLTMSAAVWPTNLVLCALFNTLHSQQYTGIGSRGGMSRERFFSVAFLCATCWCKDFSFPSNRRWDTDLITGLFTSLKISSLGTSSLLSRSSLGCAGSDRITVCFDHPSGGPRADNTSPCTHSRKFNKNTTQTTLNHIYFHNNLETQPALRVCTTYPVRIEDQQ